MPFLDKTQWESPIFEQNMRDPNIASTHPVDPQNMDIYLFS